MQNSDISTVRGLSIASIVLSALALVGSLLFLVLIAWCGQFVGDPVVYAELVSSGDVFSSDSASYLSSMSEAEYAQAMTLGVGLVCAICGVGAAFSGVGLVCGIVGVKNCGNPQKWGSVFGWSIAGAVCALLMGRFISAVIMFVNMAIANRLRRNASVCYNPPSAS